MNTENIFLKGARLIDPLNDINKVYDIYIRDGELIEIGECLDVPDVCTFYNCAELYASPGWIDFHTHVYEYATKLGVNVDETCLQNGVTTVVDAGSSGCATFLGLKKFIMEKSTTRVKAFLHVANHGLASATCTSESSGGESDSIHQLDELGCIRCIEQNNDDIVGIKIRLSKSACNDGKNENILLEKAINVRDRFRDKPLMTHHADSSVPVESSDLGCPSSLKKGDIYTHMFHSYIISNGNVHDAFKQARARGVLFDVGHGMGSFSWNNATICANEKFWPDIISTDLHSFSLEGPAYNLPIVMSKLYHLGMSLSDLIKAVTYTPASAMHMEDLIGTLHVNKKPDITLFKIIDVNKPMEDCFGEVRTLTKLIVPVAVFRDGKNIFFRR